VPLTNAQFAQGLRELAAIYESDERMVQPTLLDMYVANTSPEAFRGSVQALAAGGKVEKLPPVGVADYFYKVKRLLPSGLVVTFSTPRHGICRRVQKMVMTDTWECADSLLDPEPN
jgi:hypothetical protein